MSGTETPDFDRLMEARKIANEAKSDRDEIKRLREALQFVADITEEELPYAKVGTGSEVALRHANRKAREALAK